MSLLKHCCQIGECLVGNHVRHSIGNSLHLSQDVLGQDLGGLDVLLLDLGGLDVLGQDLDKLDMSILD